MCSSLPTRLRKWIIRIGIHKMLYLYPFPFSTFYAASRDRDVSIYLSIYLSTSLSIHLYDNLEPVYLKSVPWSQCSLQIVFRFCYQKHLQFVHLDILLLFWVDNFHYVEWSRVSFYIIIRNSSCESSQNKINSDGLEMRKIWELKVIQIRELYTLEKLISNLYSIIYIYLRPSCSIL